MSTDRRQTSGFNRNGAAPLLLGQWLLLQLFDRNFWIPSCGAVLCCVVSIPLNNHDAPPAFRIDLLAEARATYPGRIPSLSGAQGRGLRGPPIIRGWARPFSPTPMLPGQVYFFRRRARRERGPGKACSECHPLCTVNGRWDPQFSNEPRHFFFSFFLSAWFHGPSLLTKWPIV
ncbi:hypothetical protein GGI42DRAFT_239205 [Trichoderma sp. SZMC 28013]